MLIPLGFLAASGGVAGDFVLLDTRVLTGNEASIVFSSLSTYSDFKHLQIRYVARSNFNDVAESMFMRMNGVDTSSYTRHRLKGNGSTVTSAGESSAQTKINGIGEVAGATAGTGVFSSGVIDILDVFSTSKNKTVRSLSGQAGGANGITLSSGAFLSTAALTSITLTTETANSFVQHSRFSLYGIRG